jgi:hypothetical protein
MEKIGRFFEKKIPAEVKGIIINHCQVAGGLPCFPALSSL